MSGSWDGTAKVWDVAGGVCAMTLGGHENGVCVLGLPGGKVGVSGKTSIVLLTAQGRGRYYRRKKRGSHR